jgi:hypothetical protein
MSVPVYWLIQAAASRHCGAAAYPN